MAPLKEEGSNGLKEHGGGGSHIVLDELDGVERPFFAFAVVVNLGRRPFVALRKVIDRLIAAGFHLLVDLSTQTANVLSPPSSMLWRRESDE
jgi:hypothetical protein